MMNMDDGYERVVWVMDMSDMIWLLDMDECGMDMNMNMSDGYEHE
jgi:hypothetical protein